MKKLLALLALSAATAAPAHAGFGVTAYGGGTNDGTTLMGIVAPSLDYRAGGILGQLHLLDTIGELPNKKLEVGLGISGVAIKKKVGENVEGVFMPGGVVNIKAPTSFNNVNWQILAETRLGAEMKQKMGIGVYVVPAIGVSNFSGQVGLSYGGTLQVSAWFVNDKDGGGGDGGGGGKKKGRKNK